MCRFSNYGVSLVNELFVTCKKWSDSSVIKAQKNGWKGQCFFKSK